MSVTASTLNEKGVSRFEIDEVIAEHLENIDSELTKHDQTIGRNYIIYSLPTVFSSRTVNKITMQKIVYASLIKSLTERGFKVKITLKDKPKLYIIWFVKISDDEMKEIDKLLIKSEMKE
jgi:hypothetical protein